MEDYNIFFKWNFPNIYILLFIFLLSFLYVFFFSDQVNPCISEFDPLLSTYMYIQSDYTRNSFGGYLVTSSFPYNWFFQIWSEGRLMVTKYMLHVSQLISKLSSWENVTVKLHVNLMCIFPLAKHQSRSLSTLPAPLFYEYESIFLLSSSQLIQQSHN